MIVKKRILPLLICICVGFALFPVASGADMGPKPSVVIDFKGLEDENYYVTLLSKTDSTGPYSAITKEPGYTMYESGDEDYDVFLKFAGYEDGDGYYFLQYFKNCGDSHRFAWTYYPPVNFKILVYFPDYDAFAVSAEAYERYAFDSYYSVSVSGTPENGNAAVSAEQSYDYSAETTSLVARVILTIALELAIALLFGYREKRQLIFIGTVNAVTQIALNVALNIINYHMGWLGFVVFYALLEIAVFAVEAGLYCALMNKYSIKAAPRWKAAVYALCANAASLAAGFGLAILIPGLF